MRHIRIDNVTVTQKGIEQKELEREVTTTIRVCPAVDAATHEGPAKSSTNRFLPVIPNAIPWRDRQQTDALIEALVRRGASDAEAIDVLAADREQLQRDVVRLLQLQPPPPIVLEAADATRVAVAAERERILSAMRDAVMGETNIRPGYCIERVRALIEASRGGGRRS